jgi:osmoprotectant transport system permease protein
VDLQELMKVWDFIRDPSNGFVEHTLDYIRIAAIAIVLAMLISIPVGILVARRPVLAFLSVNLSGLMRAIPVIAFMAAAWPFLGFGTTPALVALTVLGIPPILLNTYTGIRDIDPAIIDAARGIGMTSWQIIRRVSTPLVLPVIAAGVRTSAVQIVATTTLAAIIGGGGYGEYIYLGLRQYDTTLKLAGTLPVILLALLVELLLSLLERALTPRGLRVSVASETPSAQGRQ